MKDFCTELFGSLKNHWAATLGLALVTLFVLVALFAPFLAPYSYSEIHEEALRLPPAWMEGGSNRFLLGTDDIGRDLLSRLIYGARVSLGVGFLVVLLSATVGTALGVLAGYKGGWVDSVIMRGVDLLMALPSVLLAIVVVSILGPSLFNTVVAVAFVALPGFVRLVRAQVLGEKKKQYVLASQSFGAKSWRQAVINILPNCMAPIIIQASLGFSDGILNAAALGFLGLGAQPPIAEWGTMLSDSRAFIESSPLMVTLPGLCILLVVIGFNMFGDGLRDALDPRLKK